MRQLQRSALCAEPPQCILRLIAAVLSGDSVPAARPGTMWPSSMLYSESWLDVAGCAYHRTASATSLGTPHPFSYISPRFACGDEWLHASHTVRCTHRRAHTRARTHANDSTHGRKLKREQKRTLTNARARTHTPRERHARVHAQRRAHTHTYGSAALRIERRPRKHRRTSAAITQAS